MTEKEILKLIDMPSAWPTTGPDRDRVLRLAAEHNSDLHQWCVSRRRRHRLVTDAVIVASIAAFVVVTALPKPDGHYVSNAHARTETLNNIDQTLLASL